MKHRSYSRDQVRDILHAMDREPPMVRFVVEQTTQQIGEMQLHFFANICSMSDEDLAEFNMASFDDCNVTWPGGRLHIAGRPVTATMDLGRHKTTGTSSVIFYLGEESNEND